MKILVLGAGAIGGYYGARLLQLGADLGFLVRPARADRLAAEGLGVSSALGDFQGTVRTVAAGGEEERFDLVLLACKAYDLAPAMDSIAPFVEAGAAVLPLLNGLSVYDRLDARFGRAAVLGGVAYIATSLAANGRIVHMGSNDRVVIGARDPSQQALARRLHDLLATGPGVRLLAPDIEQALWDKWAMLAAGAAATCLMRGNVGQIMRSPGGESVLRAAIAECAAVATASGHALADATLRQIESSLLDAGSTWAASMMRDIAQGAPRIEADDIVGDMLLRAERHGQDARLLRVAYAHLKVYESTAAAAK